jgi:uncharacterized protein with PIN domain
MVLIDTSVLIPVLKNAKTPEVFILHVEHSTNLVGSALSNQTPIHRARAKPQKRASVAKAKTRSGR